MKRANHLLEKIAEPDNLREAFLRAARAKGAKREVIEFRKQLNPQLAGLRRDLLKGTVVLGKFHSFTIYDPKERQIHAAAFPERVLHHAIVGVCEPIFERVAISDSYACRVGRGSRAAVDRASRLARRHLWFLQMDVCKYFDSIDHEVLKSALRRPFKDRALLRLFDRIIDSYRTLPGKGLPIGSLTSQHFANFYLGRLDRFVKETLRLPYVRYMDDLVCWAEDRECLKSARKEIVDFAAEVLRLEMKPGCGMNRCREGLNFLGYRVLPNCVRLTRRSARRFRDKMNRLEHQLLAGRITPLEYQKRSASLCAFTQWAQAHGFRQRWILGSDSRAQTALTEAAVGTTTRVTAGQPTATGTGRTTATTTSASASPSAQAGRVETRPD